MFLLGILVILALLIWVYGKVAPTRSASEDAYTSPAKEAAVYYTLLCYTNYYKEMDARL
jgi:hypothetical protein